MDNTVILSGGTNFCRAAENAVTENSIPKHQKIVDGNYAV